MLYCPNYNCQTLNLETHRFCQKCRSPLPRHYLWAVGDRSLTAAPGELLAGRYLCKAPRIFLDTKPGLNPALLTELPPASQPYLRLASQRLHVPQVYEVVLMAPPAEPILLLDWAAFQVTDPAIVPPATTNSPFAELPPQSVTVNLLPGLDERWASAGAMRQLNWLWQMAHLWRSLAEEGVVTSLLTPDLLRVEGTLVRLLELRSDQSSVPLVHLGQLWQSFAQKARPEIAASLQGLCQQIVKQQIQQPEQVIDQLDGLLYQIEKSRSRQYNIATRTDQGPSRQRNEDSCFPPNGTVLTDAGNALVIVCDGIGGHQGGDVASNTAIDSLRQQLQQLSPRLSAAELMAALEEAVRVANDVISDRNDSEQRHDRQRMGTTLVMALIRGHELYITHVGDSRAYWITPYSSHQMTLDDDVASREMRLGYASYRQAIMQPSAGSLVQALGMGPSTALHPTVQRFILDEDCAILLCSDGLSDNDRVETFWDIFLLPLLEGQADAGTTSQQLVDLANTANGHDNTTIGLIHCQVAGSVFDRPVAPPAQSRTAIVSPTVPPTAPPAPAAVESGKTQLLPTPTPNRTGISLGKLLFSILLLAGGIAGLSYALSFSFRNWVDTRINPPAPTSIETLPASPPVTSLPPTIPNLAVGDFLQVRSDTAPLTLQAVANQPPISRNAVPPGSVLQVIGKRSTTPQDRWVQLKVCSTPAIAPTPATPDPAVVSPAPPVLPDVPQPGDVGQIQETVLQPSVNPKPSLTAIERGICSGVTAPAAPAAPAAPVPQPTDVDPV